MFVAPSPTSVDPRGQSSTSELLTLVSHPLLHGLDYSNFLSTKRNESLFSVFKYLSSRVKHTRHFICIRFVHIKVSKIHLHTKNNWGHLSSREVVSFTL